MFEINNFTACFTSNRKLIITFLDLKCLISCFQYWYVKISTAIKWRFKMLDPIGKICKKKKITHTHLLVSFLLFPICMCSIWYYHIWWMHSSFFISFAPMCSAACTSHRQCRSGDSGKPHICFLLTYLPINTHNWLAVAYIIPSKRCMAQVHVVFKKPFWGEHLPLRCVCASGFVHFVLLSAKHFSVETDKKNKILSCAMYRINSI